MLKSNNPLFISILISIVIFVIMYYRYNKQKDKKNKKTLINKSIVLCSLFAGVFSWFIINYVSDTQNYIDLSSIKPTNIINANSVSLPPYFIEYR